MKYETELEDFVEVGSADSKLTFVVVEERRRIPKSQTSDRPEVYEVLTFSNGKRDTELERLFCLLRIKLYSFGEM